MQCNGKSELFCLILNFCTSFCTDCQEIVESMINTILKSHLHGSVEM